MMPYINPNYFSQPQYQNMYQPQSIPTYQPTTQQSLVGRSVDNFGEITANDVPMSGIAVFPKRDCSEVQIREWCSDGTIKTTSFLPIKPLENEKTSISPLNELNSVLEGIREQIDALQKDVVAISDSIRPNSRSRKANNNESNAVD